MVPARLPEAEIQPIFPDGGKIQAAENPPSRGGESHPGEEAEWLPPSPMLVRSLFWHGAFLYQVQMFRALRAFRKFRCSVGVARG